jgi:hypothetical protein
MRLLAYLLGIAWLLAPLAAPASQYVLKISDAPWPVEADFGTDTGLADDNFFPAINGQGIALGFDFPFYCNTYDEVYIDANGFVTLGSTAIAPPGDGVPVDVGNGWDDTDNFPFPLLDSVDNNQELYPIPMIAAFWSDITTIHGAGGGVQGNGQIWWRLDSTSSPKRLIVTWEDVFHYKKGNDGDSNTTGNNVQLILYEDGRIQINYGDIGWSGLNVYYRKAATIGLYSGDHTGGACDDGSTPVMELFPADVNVAGKQLLYLFDDDDDKIPDDGDGSGVAGDVPCQELLEWPAEPYNDPYGICSVGLVGLGCLEDVDCDTTPGAGDGICEPCDVCVSCDDNCPVVYNSDQFDTDVDAMGDACDPDDDNDGILDGSDTFPLDTDNDGVNNAVDPDDDNDGILDVNDTYPLDTDNDGLDNAADNDDDNDGLADGNDPLPLLYNYADGDLDTSGAVNAADALIVMQIASGMRTPTTVHLQHGDVTPMGGPDGFIDLPDALMVIRKAVGEVVY